MTARLQYAPSLVEALKALSEGRREAVLSRLAWFVRAPDDPHLRLRPLRCATGYFLIDSVRYDRVILRREADGSYTVVDCGGHHIIGDWEARGGRPP